MAELSYAVMILTVTALLILTSLLTIAVIVTNENLRSVLGCYLISLAVSDLLCGVLVTPLALFAALEPEWEFGGSEALLCKMEAYFGVMLWASVAYVFMWIGVDRYAALAKPTRYEVEQTFTRCKCWILFTWISALLLSCPILAAEMEARYYPQAFLCVLHWSATKAYSATLAALVLAPSAIGTIYSYWYILSSLRNPQDLEDSQKAVLESDQNYMMSLFVILSFGLSWGPWFALQTTETATGAEMDVRPLHFSLLWLAISGGCWKLVIYLTMNRDFRQGLSSFWARLFCCAPRSAAYAQTAGHNEPLHPDPLDHTSHYQILPTNQQSVLEY